MCAASTRAGGSTLRTILWVVLALGGIALWLVTLNAGDVPRAWRSLLINFLFFGSLSGGLVVWPAVVRTSNGRWAGGLERLAAAGIVFAIPSLVALAGIWIGSPGWSPWYNMSYHQGGWLDNAFVFCRDLVALLLFWLLAAWYLLLRRKGEARYCGPFLIILYSVVFSLLGFDLVMSLDPAWNSNLAGGYFFMSGLYIAITCWGLMAALTPESSPDQRQDIAKLMVAFSMMTIYLMFAHLNLMWYENLPHEVRFLVPRMHIPGWTAVSYFIVGLPYFGPLVLLLMIKAKRNRLSLGIISVLLLCGLWIERWWLIAPTFDSTVRLGLTELSMAAACLGVLGLGMEQFLRHLPERYMREEKQQ